MLKLSNSQYPYKYTKHCHQTLAINSTIVNLTTGTVITRYNKLIIQVKYVCYIDYPNEKGESRDIINLR